MWSREGLEAHRAQAPALGVDIDHHERRATERPVPSGRAGVDDPRPRAAIHGSPMGMSVDHHTHIGIAFTEPAMAALHAVNLMTVNHCQPPARQREHCLPWKLLEPRVFARTPLRGDVVVAAHSGYPPARSCEGVEDSAAADVAGVHRECAPLDGSRDSRVELPVSIRDQRDPKPRTKVRRLFDMNGGIHRSRTAGRKRVEKGRDASGEPAGRADRAGPTVYPPADPGAANRSRSFRRRTFPTFVLGRSCVNSMCLGRL